MTDTTADTSPTEAQHPGRRRVLGALCVTEITSWGILYYAFPVLAPSISADTGWSATSIVAAFTVGQLVAALVGIPVGRVLDRHGPRWVMTTGSIIAVPAVVVIATAPSLPVFYAGWVIAGVSMGAVLYPPAFAALTRWWGGDRVRALMILTLAAGLASTVFAPATAALTGQFGWRSTYVVLAAFLLVVTVPLHAFGLRGSWPPAHPGVHAALPESRSAISRSQPFLVLTVSLSMAAFASFAAVFNLVPLLLERGVDATLAATTLGLGGAGQVLGRLGYLPLQRLTGTRWRTVSVIAATALSTAMLGLATTTLALVLLAVGAGLARGIFTLVQATAITDRWGPVHYGHLGGIMNAPIVITMAFGPWGGAVLAEWTGSYARAFLVLGVIAVSAAGLAAFSMPGVQSGRFSVWGRS